MLQNGCLAAHDRCLLCTAFCKGEGNFGFHSRFSKKTTLSCVLQERCEPLWAAQVGEQTPILGNSFEEFFPILLFIHQKAYFSLKNRILKSKRTYHSKTIFPIHSGMFTRALVHLTYGICPGPAIVIVSIAQC